MEEAPRKLRKERVGKVVSDKMDKSLIMEIVTRSKHPMYGKFMIKTSHLMVHDEKNECHNGDTIRVMETRPLSKNKRWRVIEIIEKAK